MLDSISDAKGTRNLIFINVIIFLATLLNEDMMVRNFALFYPTSPLFRWWQLVTHMFMHGGFAHIFFNMYALYMFGTAVERTIGTRKFLVLYFIAGFGAVALHFAAMHVEIASLPAARIATLNYTPTVGASGAIYGLLISYAMLYPQSRLTLIFPPITLTAKTWVIIWAVIELFTGVRGVLDGVAHFAHLGGMLFGWLLIRYWKNNHTLYDGYQGW